MSKFLAEGEEEEQEEEQKKVEARQANTEPKQAATEGRWMPLHRRLLPDGVRLRPFVSEDGAQCENLERNFEALPSGNAFTQRFYRISVESRESFDMKIRQYGPDGKVFVVEDTASSLIVGVVSVTVKSVRIGGALLRAGHVFGLCVDAAWQARSLGMALLREAELAAEGLGAEVLCVNVPVGNSRIERFFARAHYMSVSRRAVFQKFLFDATSARPPPEAGVEDSALSALEAADTLRRAFSEEDMWSAEGCSELLTSPGSGFVGTIISRHTDDASVGGVSIWDPTKLRPVYIQRFLIPVSWLEFLFSPAALAVALSTWFAALCSVSTMWRVGRRQECAVLVIGLLAATAFMAMIWHPGRFLRRILTDTGLLMTPARLFAPFARGPSGEKMLARAVLAAETHAASLGFMAIVASLDERDPSAAVFQKRRDVAGWGGRSFHSNTLQKRVQKRGAKKPDRPDMLSPGSFFDPRDS